MIRQYLFSTVIALWIGAVAAAEPPKPAPSAIHIAIDATDACTIETKPVVCDQVAAFIRKNYPHASPRIFVCPDHDTHYGAVAKVMRALENERFLKVSFHCEG